VDFSLSDEERAIRETARTFIRKEVMPLEDDVLLLVLAPHAARATVPATAHSRTTGLTRCLMSPSLLFASRTSVRNPALDRTPGSGGRQ